MTGVPGGANYRSRQELAAIQKKIGKFEIIGELGRGAMGVVYRGKDPFIGRTVAIKTITGNFTDNPDLLERFYREARAAGGLQHPNIVTIYDMGEDNGTPYIAMELLEGDDLSHMVEKEKEDGGQNPLPASIKLNYIVQVCRALEFAHKRNIVHRDIKPGNIVVTNDGTVKVVDFGIARLTDTSSTSSGMLIGTIDYMSPEQIRGEKVDGRSDIWAVGVMMYEILTYTKPFQGGNITAVMFAIVSQEPKSLLDLRPDLPPELDEVMRRIFKKEPAERYQNMDELLGQLEPIVRRMQQESVGELVTQSENLLKKGELQRAKELLKQALVLDTSHLHAKTLLDRVNSEIRRSEVLPKLGEIVAKAEQHLQAGNLEDARREADAALHLDSNFMPARELLGKVQEAAMQAQIVQSGMREARQRLAEGSLTEADQSLEKVLKAAPDNQDAQSLRKQIAEEKDRREKRRHLTDGVQRVRQLWTGQQFDEALKLLGELDRSFPGEAEVAKLLEAVRADQSQDEIQKALGEARKLLGAQSFNEALGTLDRLLQRHPNESAAAKLRELVLEERSEHARQLRLQKELESLKRLVNEEKFQDAISNGEALLKEYPEDFELGRLVDFAKTQRAQQDVLRRRQTRHQEINNFVQAGNFDGAVTACQEALKEFQGDAEFKQRLDQVTTQQKESKNRERQKLLDERLRTMRQAIERGDLTGAIDMGNRTVVQTGKDTDLTKLIEMAKQERSLRDLRRNHDEQTLKAIDLLEDKKFDEAAKILRVLDRDELMDQRVPALLRAAEDRRVPTKEELTLMRSKPGQRSEEEGDLGKTRVAGIGGIGGKPFATPAPAGDAGGATRVFRPEIGEETVKFKSPPAAAPAPPAPVSVGMNAAAVAPPPPAEEKTTIVPPAIGEATAIAPPKPKEEKKEDKKKKEKEKGRKVEEPIAAAPPAVATPPAPPAVKPEPKPEIKPVPAPPAPRPAPPVAAPVAAAAPQVTERPPKPSVEERKEAAVKPAPFEAISAPPAKRGGMGIIIGGVVVVAVIGVGVYMFMGHGNNPPNGGTGTTTTTTTTTTPPGGETTPGGKTTATPVPPQPVVQTGPSPDEKKATEMIQQAMKVTAKGDYDGGRKRLTDAENFVKSKNLGGNFITTIESDRAQIEKVQNNKELAASLQKSNDLFDTANAAISAGQWDRASQSLDQLQGLGEGAAHKDEIPNLRNQIEGGKKLDGQFAQAQSQANSNDEGSLFNAKTTMDAIANTNGRHSGEARTIAKQLETKINTLKAEALKAEAAARGKEKADKINSITSEIHQLESASDFAGARSKLSELQGLGENTSGLSAEIEKAEKTFAASQRSASCTVGQVARQKWSNPLKAGQEMGQSFLDANLELSAGTNCGLAAAALQAAPKGEVKLLVNIDTDGKVVDGRVLIGDPSAGSSALAAAKRSWHFSAPKANGTPVKTSASVVVRFN